MKYIKLKYEVCEAGIYYKDKYIGWIWKEKDDKLWSCEAPDGKSWETNHEKDAIAILRDHYEAKK